MRNSSSRNKLCRVCSKSVNRNKYIRRWLLGLETGNVKNNEQLHDYIRDFLLNYNNNMCSKCGWNEINITSNRCPLTVNHINGKSWDSRLINLEILCPNCHSLTYNYGSLNIGSGRPSKRKAKIKPDEC